MQIIVDNCIRIRGAPVPVIMAVTKALSMDNPEYIKRKKRGKGTWGVPTKLELYTRQGNDLYLPRGFIHELEEILVKLGIAKEGELKSNHITCNYTEGLPASFGPWNPEYTLWPDQQDAVLDVLKYDDGTLISPAGSGKTVMGLYVVYMRGRCTLWLTHTVDLMEQTEKKAKALLQGVDEVGLLGGGIRRWGSGKLIIGMVDTLSENPDLIAALKPVVGTLIIDECLTGDTLITMKDGTLQRIKDITDGDQVLGGVVSNSFKRQGEVYQVVTQAGEVNCTGTHKHIAVKRSSINRNTRENKNVLPTGENVTAVTTRDLQPGDYLLVPECVPVLEQSNWTPEQLAFVALIMTDGHVEKSRVKVAVRTDVELYRNIFEDGARSFGFSFKESVNSRGDTVFWTTDKNCINTLVNDFGIPMGKKSKVVDIPRTIITAPPASVLAFINSVFSTEGTVNKGRLVLDMTSFNFITKMQHILKTFGIHGWRLTRERKSGKHGDIYRLSVGGSDLVRLIFMLGRLYNGRKQAAVESWTPSGKGFGGYSVTYNGTNYRLVKVKSITYKGTETVYDFTTTYHNFIANNHLTHNCHHFPAQSFLDVAGKFACKYFYGVTATPDRKDGMERYLYVGVGPERHRVDRDILHKTGRLIMPELQFVYTNYGKGEGTVNEELKNVDSGGEELDYTAALQALLADEERVELIAHKIIDEAQGGNYSLVLCESVRYCFMLRDRIKELFDNELGPWAPRMAVVHGGISKYAWRTAKNEKEALEAVALGLARKHKYDPKARRWKIEVEKYSDEEIAAWQVSPARRREIMQLMAEKKIDILFATQLAREGLDIPHLNILHLATPKRGDNNEAGRTDGANVEQEVGRVQRPDPANPNKTAKVIDYVDFNVGVFQQQYYSRRRVYKRLGFKVPPKPRTRKDEIEAFLSSMPY